MKRIVLLALALVMVLSIAACNGGKGETPAPAADSNTGNTQTQAPDTGPPAAAGPKYGGTLTVQLAEFNTVFDPAMGEMYVYSLWMEYLFAPNWGLNDPSVYGFKDNVYNYATAAGQIAKSWDWDPNAKTLSVTINDNIYFQQKDAAYDIFKARNLTAEDVKYSYDRVIGTGSGFNEDNFVRVDADWRRRMDMLDSIEVTGAYSLVFHLNTASETKLSELVIAQINITGPEWDTLTPDQQNDWHYACGTGPFILTDYVPDNHFTFVRNENYYAYDERNPGNKLPYLDGIVLQKYNDSTSIISSFIAGNLDYVAATAGLTSSEKEQIRNNSSGCRAIPFAAAAEAIGLKANQAPFNDIRVRIAMQKAINLQEVTTAYYGLDELEFPGLWSPQLRDFSSVSDWDAALIGEYTYDPDGAKELLAQAGYPDGFTFDVAIDARAQIEVFQLAKGYLAQVGITMNIETLTDMMAGREIQGNKDDPRQFNFGVGASVDVGFSFQSYASTGFAYCTYAYDTHMDDLLVATRDAMTTDAQNAAAKESDLYFAQQHWYIALSGITQDDAFVSSRLGGLQNGENFDAGHFFKTIAARIWNEQA